MFHTLETFDTEFSADSVEWCPAENFQDIFVCGTYQLTPENTDIKVSENKKRFGRIYVFQVIRNENLELKLLQQLDVAAVLDMKWAHTQCFDKTLLGVVNSKGFLQIYELTKDKEKIVLELVTKILVDDTENSPLALSLDWSTGTRNIDQSSEIKISVSDSKGSVSLFKLSKQGSEIEKINSWHAHEFEAWITAFDYWNTNIIYTGGDDCKFLRFDTRIESTSPTNTNRSHNAGVTSIHCNWKKEYSLVSGSYDETLRTWDTRNLRRPLGNVDLGGGIWRLKWDPYRAQFLLAACMYNGFFVVDCSNLEVPQVVATYTEHESIAYGCDWLHATGQSSVHELLSEESETLVGTCSFYDHVLKLSSVKIEGLGIS